MLVVVSGMPRCQQVFTAAQDPLMTNTKMAKTARPPLWEKEEAARQFFSYHR